MSGPDRDQRHDAAWRERFDPLTREDPVEKRTQDRTVTALRAARLLRSGGPSGSLLRTLRLIAATVVLFLAGAFWGARPDTGTGEPPLPRYALLLLEDSTFSGTATVGHDSLVAEYAAWAGELAGTGSLVVGEELDQASYPLGEVGPGAADRVTGLFVIAAESLERALDIARRCPHLRYGGGIVVRPIAPA